MRHRCAFRKLTVLLTAGILRRPYVSTHARAHLLLMRPRETMQYPDPAPTSLPRHVRQPCRTSGCSSGRSAYALSVKSLWSSPPKPRKLPSSRSVSLSPVSTYTERPCCSPHGQYRPWDSPGLNTAVGSHSLHQGIFPTQGLNPHLLHFRWILYQLSYQGSPLSKALLFKTTI